MAITGLRVFSVPVSDQDRSLGFYRDVLGAKLVSDVVMSPKMRWIELAFGESFTHLSLVTWFDSYVAGTLTGAVLETADLEGDLSRLDENKVGHSGIETAPWGRYATFQDPDGNGWILQVSNS